VAAHPDASAAVGATLMLRHRLSCLPLVEHTHLVGVVKLDEFVRLAARFLYARKEKAGADPVADLMTPAPLCTVELLATVAAAEERMETFHVRHLPVMHRGHIVGIFSDRDLGEVYRGRGDAGREILVGEVMSAAPFQIDVDGDAAAAANELVAREIGALPVMRGDELAGILCKSDFLHYIRG
jgi:CBS domain-containing protein